ncbi:hypothetical protein [Streptomyces sp. NPDC055058]
MADLRVTYEVELTVIRPGDTALVRVARDMTPEQVVRLRDALREQLPGVTVVLLAGVDGIDVYRPDEAGGPDGGERTGAEGPGEASAS